MPWRVIQKKLGVSVWASNNLPKWQRITPQKLWGTHILMDTLISTFLPLYFDSGSRLRYHLPACTELNPEKKIPAHCILSSLFPLLKSSASSVPNKIGSRRGTYWGYTRRALESLHLTTTRLLVGCMVLKWWHSICRYVSELLIQVRQG